MVQSKWNLLLYFSRMVQLYVLFCSVPTNIYRIHTLDIQRSLIVSHFFIRSSYAYLRSKVSDIYLFIAKQNLFLTCNKLYKNLAFVFPIHADFFFVLSAVKLHLLSGENISIPKALRPPLESPLKMYVSGARDGIIVDLGHLRSAVTLVFFFPRLTIPRNIFLFFKYLVKNIIGENHIESHCHRLTKSPYLSSISDIFTTVLENWTKLTLIISSVSTVRRRYN